MWTLAAVRREAVATAYKKGFRVEDWRPMLSAQSIKYRFGDNLIGNNAEHGLSAFVQSGRSQF